MRAGQLGSSSLTGMATGNQSASFPHLTNSWDVSFLLRDFLFICSELVLSSTGLKIHDSFQKNQPLGQRGLLANLNNNSLFIPSLAISCGKLN